jgi:hypothetical protein
MLHLFEIFVSFIDNLLTFRIVSAAIPIPNNVRIVLTQYTILC